MDQLEAARARPERTKVGDIKIVSARALPAGARNHEITEATLREDFEIDDHTQRGLSEEFQQHLYFGRFEGAFTVFNQTVNAYLGSA